MTEDPPKQARTWGMACHLSALVMFATVPLGTVLGMNIAGPLLVWLIRGKEFPFVDEQGKEAVNFQILMALVGIVPFIFVPAIRIPLQIGWTLLNLALIFVASVKASNGQTYRYPVPIRLLR